MSETPAKRPPLLAPDAVVDHYRVVRELGRGGMGEVYLARDTHLGRKVALKVVRAEALGDPRALKRFLREARVTAHFSHPHIVTIYGVGEYAGCPYLALEYLEGQTLEERLAEQRPGVKEALRLGLAVARALKEAHGHKVLHRDLKPQNIFIPRDGRVRVLDFGLARLVTEGEEGEEGEARRGERVGRPLELDDDALLTETVAPAAAEQADATGRPASAALQDPFSLLEEQAGARGAVFETLGHGLRGTPAFMAPEQWADETLGPAADIWALGTILYELLSGRAPYPDAAVFRLAFVVCNADPVPSVAEAAPELPQRVVELVDRCLAKDPTLRPSAEAVVAKLDGLIAAAGPERPEGDDVDSPYRGLLPFAERHADLFFGREAEIAGFLERMREESVLPVVGPSGAGKSSFIQAGVIPRLREQGGAWAVIRVRPGARPFETLARRLLAGGSSTRASLDPLLSGVQSGAVQASAGQEAAEQELARELLDVPTRLALHLGQLADAEQCRVLLFVDQLEELYTLVPDEQVRRRFMLALCTSADDPFGPVRTVFSLRDDFLWRLAAGEEARSALGRVTVLRPPETRALAEILERPLASVGYRFETKALVQQMVAEVRGEAAALPLLEFAAQRLWEQRDRESQQLTQAAHDEAGGVAGALARHADGLLDTLTSTEERLARQLLLRLVTPQGTRRVVPRSALLDGLEQRAVTVLERLSAARLVLARKGRAEAELELVHESLIRHWDRLAQWLEASRDEREFLTQVGQAAELWEARGRPDEEAWSGDALAEALRRAERCRAIPEPVQRFLAAGSRRARSAERRKRRLMLAGTVALALVALTAILVGLALRTKEREAQRQKGLAQARGEVAERQRREAVQQRAEAQREGARAAYGRGALVEARAKLRGALESEDSPLGRALWWRLSRERVFWRRPLGATLYDVAFAPDGQTVAVASMDRTIHLLDVHTGVRRVLRGHGDQLLALAYAPDGARLAAATYGGEVRIWELKTRSSRTLPGHTTAVKGLDFSPDGRLLASAGADGMIRVWEADTGRVRAVLRGHTGQVHGIDFDPTGRTLVSAGADRTVRRWDVERAAELQTVNAAHGAAVLGVRFAPSGERLATCSVDRTIRLWTLERGRLAPGRVLRGHAGNVLRVAFSKSGKLLASAGADRTVRLWRTRDGGDGGAHAVLRGHEAQVRAVAFSPDGARLASVSWDQTLRIWDVTRARRATTTGGHKSQVNGVDFSPDGATLASAGVDGAVLLWDVRGGRVKQALRGHSATAWGVRFSPDGALLASASSDKTVRLWDLRTGAARTVLKGHASQVWSVDFVHGGALLATGGSDKTIRLWDVRSGAERATLRGHAAAVWNVRAAGRRLVSAGDDKTARLWSLPGGRPLGPARAHPAAVYDAALSPDGRLLATACNDKRVRTYTLAGGQSRTLGPLGGRAYALDFQPAGALLGVASSDGAGQLWDLRAGGSTVLRGHRGEMNDLRFSPDGKLVATSGDDGTVRLWDPATGRPRWRAPLLRRRGDDGAELLTHLGWVDLARGRQGPEAPPRAGAAATNMTARGRKAATIHTTRWRAAVDRHARLAEASDQLLCLGTHDDVLELWDLRADRRLRTHRLPDLQQVLALADGCVTRSAGTVLRFNRTGPPKILAHGVTAAARDGARGVLLATGRAVVAYDADGRRRSSYSADVGITALTQVRQARGASWIVVGYKDGGVELLPTTQGKRRPGFSFEDTPASQVVRLIQGPTGTVVAGFANGLVGLWSLKNGIRLEQRRIHGPVIHLLLLGNKLHAASELGQYTTLDLSVFQLPYCELLRKVWARIPVAWEGGLPLRRPPPDRHRCK